MEAGFTAPTINFAVELAEWRKIANELTVKTRLIWQDGRFRNYYVVSQEWSTEQDTMRPSFL